MYGIIHRKTTMCLLFSVMTLSSCGRCVDMIHWKTTHTHGACDNLAKLMELHWRRNSSTKQSTFDRACYKSSQNTMRLCFLCLLWCRQILVISPCCCCCCFCLILLFVVVVVAVVFWVVFVCVVYAIVIYR